MRGRGRGTGLLLAAGVAGPREEGCAEGADFCTAFRCSCPARPTDDQSARPAHPMFSCPSPDIYVSPGVDARVEPESIGKGRIRRLYFQVTYMPRSKRVSHAESGGASIAPTILF